MLFLFLISDVSISFLGDVLCKKRFFFFFFNIIDKACCFFLSTEIII